MFPPFSPIRSKVDCGLDSSTAASPISTTANSPHRFGSKDGLGADLVWNLLLDRGGALWAATDGGLSRIKDGRVATLTTKNGLPCDVVRMVLEDDASSLWLYTACGLVRIAHSELDAWASNPKRIVQTTVFDSSDGVRSSAVVGRYGPRATKSLDGKLWFAHGDGVSVVDPRHLLFQQASTSSTDRDGHGR